MNTIIRKMNKNQIDKEAIEIAGNILKEGGLVAFPTETVYGLGADALNEDAAAKTYEAKGRPSDNPLIVHIAEFGALGRIVKDIPDTFARLGQAFWPGPLTLIFEKSEEVPYGTTGGLDTVAVRMPNHKIARELILAGGGYISAPSANTSGRPSPTDASHVEEDLAGKIDMIIDGGSVEIGVESTILDMTVTPPMILRPGAVTKEMLEEVIGEVTVDRAIVSENSGQAPKAPGMKYRHYAPKAKLSIVEGTVEDTVKAIRQIVYDHVRRGEKAGIIASDETMELYTTGVIKTIGTRADESTIAKNLYRILREFDEEEVSYIYSEAFADEGIGHAIMNRLSKAAGHQVILAEEILKHQKYRKIIIVTSGDVSRGPMAVQILKRCPLLQEYEICSRGLVVLFPEPVNQKAEAILASKKMSAGAYSATQLNPEDMTSDTLILVLEDSQKRKVLAEYETAEHVYTIGEFIGEPVELESPYGQPLQAYGEAFNKLQAIMKKVAERLNKEAK